MGVAIVLLIAALSAASLIFLFSILKKIRDLKWIPGPPTLPLIGNLHQLIGTPEDFFILLCETYKKHGGIFKFWILSYPVVFVQHIDYLQPLLKCSKNITKSPEYSFIRPYIGEGLLLSTGQKWRNRRKMLTPSFHLGILENMTSPMIEQAMVLVEQLQKHATDGKPFNLLPYIKMCALDIMIETSIGRKIQAQINPMSSYVQAIDTMSRIAMKRTRLPYLWPDFLYRWSSLFKEQQKTVEIVRNFSAESILEKRNKRKEDKNAKSTLENGTSMQKKKRRLALLDLLLEVEEEEGLMDSDIQEEVDTFVFEGHDTTAAGTTFGLFLLGHHSHFQDKIVEELDEIIPDFQENGISIQDLGKLDFLERCVKETLRLYPSALIVSRKLVAPFETDHGTIPVGTTVTINFYNHHRDEEFFPNPELFDPDRFLPENVEKRHPFAYVPFSAGPRNCIGQKFALMEMKILLATMLKNYRVKSYDKPEDLKLIANLIITSSSGMTVELTPRGNKS